MKWRLGVLVDLHSFPLCANINERRQRVYAIGIGRGLRVVGRWMATIEPPLLCRKIDRNKWLVATSGARLYQGHSPRPLGGASMVSQHPHTAPRTGASSLENPPLL